MVRYGLRLREGGNACNEDPWNAGTQPLWQAVDKQFGPQFRQQTDIRRRAFEREFGQDATDRLSAWDARIVFYYRHYPLSDVYCAGIKSALAEMRQKGWNSFVKRAAVAMDDVRMMYVSCEQ